MKRVHGLTVLETEEEVEGLLKCQHTFVRKQVEFMDHDLDVEIAKGKYVTRTNANHENIARAFSFMKSCMNSRQQKKRP